MVELDPQRRVGSVLFEDEGTAKLYAAECQAYGLGAIVIPRVVICETSAEWMVQREVKVAS
jgi:hypothetical protein